MAERMFKHVVGIVTEAWNDDSISPQEAAERACKFMHNPFFADEDEPLHKMMHDYVIEWLEQTDDEKDEILSRCTSANPRRALPAVMVLTLDTVTRQSIIDQKHNTEGLRNRSTINRDIPKPKTSRIASKGLFGLIGMGFKKCFSCCGSPGNDDEE